MKTKFLGFAGINTAISDFARKPEEVDKIVNGRLDPLGSIKKRKGLTQVGGTISAGKYIRGLYSFYSYSGYYAATGGAFCRVTPDNESTAWTATGTGTATAGVVDSTADIADSSWKAGQWDSSDADGNYYKDDTTDAQDAGADDFAIGADGANGDGIAIGCNYIFDRAEFTVGATPDSGDGGGFAYTYWDGSAWSALTIVTTPDFTDDESTQAIAFNPPLDWQKGGTGGVNQDKYWIRLLQATAPTTVALCDDVNVMDVYMNISCTTTQAKNYRYTDTTLNNSTGTTVEFRHKVVTALGAGDDYWNNCVIIRDGTQSVCLALRATNIKFKGTVNKNQYNMTTTNWQLYRITLKGNSVKVYVNGILRLSDTVNSPTSSQFILFGDYTATASSGTHAEKWGFVRYWTNGAHAPWQGAGVHTRLAVCNNDLYKDVDGTWTSISQSLTDEGRTSMVGYIGSCFFCNGIDNLKEYDGTNVYTSETWHASTNVFKAAKGRYVIECFGRLIVTGDEDDPTRVNFSTPIVNAITYFKGDQAVGDCQAADNMTVDSTEYFRVGQEIDVLDLGTTDVDESDRPVDAVPSRTTFSLSENLTDGVADGQEIVVSGRGHDGALLWDCDGDNQWDLDHFYAGKNDQQAITGAAEFNDLLLIFKRDYIYIYNNEFVLTSVIEGVGTLAHDTIKNYKGAVFFLHDSGVWAFTGNGVAKVSAPMQKYIDVMPLETEACGLVNKGKYYVYIGSLNEEFSDIEHAILEFDIEQESWALHSLNVQPTVFANFEVSNEQKITFGTTEGKVYYLFDGDDDDGTNIHFVVETNWLPLGLPEINKMINYFCLFSKEPCNIGISVAVDYGTEFFPLKSVGGEKIKEIFDIGVSGRVFKFRYSQIDDTRPHLQGFVVGHVNEGEHGFGSEQTIQE